MALMLFFLLLNTNTTPPGFAPGKPCKFRDFAVLSFYYSPYGVYDLEAVYEALAQNALKPPVRHSVLDKLREAGSVLYVFGMGKTLGTSERKRAMSGEAAKQGLGKALPNKIPWHKMS